MCNLFYRNARYIPIVFHNLSNYDAHFIIKEIASNETLKGNVKIIAKSSERYISFTKHVKDMNLSFRFIDSFRFMPLSLEKLASTLKDFDILDKEFAKDGITDTTLLKTKGIFPYEYIQSFHQLQEHKLPEKDKFYSKLMNSGISDGEYEHAQKVWQKYNSGKTLGSYADLYLKCDVLLLGCIYESFRSVCMRAYSLDPAHYYTTPGLAWDAFLKLTKVKLSLLTDINMVLFIERGNY